jgi:predicted metal-dependent hydrolase
MIPVELGGPDRKARLTIERDGSLTLRAAADVNIEELRAFVSAKRDWIYRKLAQKDVLRYKPVTKELVSGEGFLYLGSSHQLRIAPDRHGSVKLIRGRLMLPADREDDGFGAIIEWYEARGRDWLPARVERWATRLRVSATQFEVGDLGHKWGSADGYGRVRIHWATMQLRPPLIDYVIAHELAHLQQPHHGPAFWQLLRRAQPDFEERKAELARVGGSLWIGATRASDNEA